jgi:hypothetical protein
MKQQVQVMKKTDVEMIPEVAELRKVLRETRFREGKLVVKDLPTYVESVKKVIPIYQELQDRKHYKETVRYAGFKLEIIANILKNNYGIELSEKK